MTKPILCLDFDGVLHSYTSGWKGAEVVADPPVDGGMEFVSQSVDRFRVCIFSSRSNQAGGVEAMKTWLLFNLYEHHNENGKTAKSIMDKIEWPLEKPPAMVTIDDRAITFDGTWPSLDELLAFRPWNKQKV